jgi:hypothetical protein
MTEEKKTEQVTAAGDNKMEVDEEVCFCLGSPV